MKKEANTLLSFTKRRTELGTVQYAGTPASLEDKLVYRDEVKGIITGSVGEKGVFLIGYSFGTGANILAAYELMRENQSTLNLKGIVTLDSYLLTGNGSGISLPGGKNPLEYDTQEKADYVTSLIPSYTAHSGQNTAPNNFPNTTGIGPELSTTHTMLANSPSTTSNVLLFILGQVIR